MPDTLNAEHPCNAYCTGARHCVEVLARADWTGAEVQAGCARLYRRYAWQVVDVRRAWEADVEAWRAAMRAVSARLTDAEALVRGQVPDGPVHAWLVWVEPQRRPTDDQERHETWNA
jgi:hypothetical protein